MEKDTTILARVDERTLTIAKDIKGILDTLKEMNGRLRETEEDCVAFRVMSKRYYIETVPQVQYNTTNITRIKTIGMIICGLSVFVGGLWGILRLAGMM